MNYVENVVAFIEYELTHDNEGGEHLYNYCDEPAYDMNHLVLDVYKCLGKNKTKLFHFPYWLAYFGGMCFDLLALITKRKFAISAIRVKKFTQNTYFVGSNIKKTDFVIEETSDGEPFCEKNWIESQAEDYFCEQNGIIELYNKSINLMLINFFVETFEGLKKNVGDKLKKEKMETTTLDRLVYASADDDMLKVRLINNCIKHNDSKVSDDLSRKFPGEYTKNDEIDINPELVYKLLEITVNAIRKFNKLFNQYYHD